MYRNKRFTVFQKFFGFGPFAPMLRPGPPPIGPPFGRLLMQGPPLSIENVRFLDTFGCSLITLHAFLY